MAVLTVRHVSDEVLARLRQRARRHRRSLQAELLAILEEAVAPDRLAIEELDAELANLGVATAGEAAAMIRQDRDAR